MNVTIRHTECESTSEQHEVLMTVNRRELSMRVNVIDGLFDSCIEYHTDVWNSLTLKEKDAVRVSLSMRFSEPTRK